MSAILLLVEISGDRQNGHLVGSAYGASGGGGCR